MQRRNALSLRRCSFFILRYLRMWANTGCMGYNGEKPYVAMEEPIMTSKRLYKRAAINAIILACVAAFAVWFMRTYDTPSSESASPLPHRAAWEGRNTESIPAALPFEVGGPFMYRFKEGQRLGYTLDAQIGGSGIDLGETSPVAMTLNSALSLVTREVDRSGNGHLRFQFEWVRMGGDFMGESLEIEHSADRSRMAMGRRVLVDTAAGDSIEGIPQLEFFATPIDMVVAPSGEVLHVEGPPGFDPAFGPSNVAVPVRFEESEIPLQGQWMSELQIPIPGIEETVPTRVENTMLGYETVNGRQCGVIHQRMESEAATPGTMFSPESILGSSMLFSMPEFKVSGENKVYFDVSDGNVTRADLNFSLDLDLGPQLQPVGDLFAMMGELLREIDGAPGAPVHDNAATENSAIELGLTVRGLLNRVQ